MLAAMGGVGFIAGVKAEQGWGRLAAVERVREAKAQDGFNVELGAALREDRGFYYSGVDGKSVWVSSTLRWTPVFRENELVGVYTKVDDVYLGYAAPIQYADGEPFNMWTERSDEIEIIQALAPHEDKLRELHVMDPRRTSESRRMEVARGN